jgi:hypothetical protein
VTYTGRGAATDIIVASAKAYMNALNRLLAAKKLTEQTSRDRSERKTARAGK